jgi:DNA mismatch repair protein MutS
MTIIDDYLDFQEKYACEYGERTCVLMQVGHFYECYAVDNAHEKTNSENIYRLSDLLNIQLTRKNKKIVESSRGNPLMIGVNMLSATKYIQLLMDNNYTTVVIDQVTEPPEPERAITGIYSPGTNINYITKGDTNNLLTVYIDVEHKENRDILHVGLSRIDVSTGKNTVYEQFSSVEDKNYALDETFRFIQVHDPKEIVFYIRSEISESNDNSSLNKHFLSSYLDLSQRIVHFKECPKDIFNLNYQNTFLTKVYPNHGMLSVIEYLDLEMIHYGRIAFILGLDFAYKHNETIISRIEKPEIWDETKYLLLTNNSVHQLNIMSHPSMNTHCKFNSLFSVINHTSTSLGKRNLKETLLNPIIDPERIQQRYDIVQAFIDDKLYVSYETYLNNIMDLERLHRKFILKLLQPSDFVGLDISYQNIHELLKLPARAVVDSIKPSKDILDHFNSFMKEYTSILNIEKMSMYHLDKIDDTFFNKGICSDIDELKEKIDKDTWRFTEIAKRLSDLIIPPKEKAVYEKDLPDKLSVHFTENERDGYYLCLTNNRATLLKKKFKMTKHHPIKIDEETIIQPADIEFKNVTKSNTRISLNLLSLMSRRLRSNRDKIGQLVRNTYLNILETLGNTYGPVMRLISEYIATIDTYKSNAKTAVMYGYVRPTIKKDSSYSFIDAKALRHPIIERINTSVEYVPNDISLGHPHQKGILLFGTNASGKSSLMKGIGINIIMAQAGMFVSAEEFTFSPYKYLFTRINNNDNIFKGESSFAVEMSELRCILKRTSDKSLVLGDELCAGTESVSALSIFASSVHFLANKHTSFIFATHLHELVNMQIIKDLSNCVSMYHLKVIYDKEKDTLIYNRILTEGSGEAIYGLEVCRAMDMDSNFLSMANQIRQELMGVRPKILDTRTSKYNSKVIVDMCQVCKTKEAEDVHHIKFQCTADNNNMIGHIQKDTKSNLVPLCKECHIKVHHGNITIHGYIQTDKGPELRFEELTDELLNTKKKSRLKFNMTDINIIKTYIEKYILLSSKVILFKLKNEAKIDISLGTFNKIKNGTYKPLLSSD